jgi:hypothetical protein
MEHTHLPKKKSDFIGEPTKAWTEISRFRGERIKHQIIQANRRHEATARRTLAAD